MKNYGYWQNMRSYYSKKIKGQLSAKLSITEQNCYQFAGREAIQNTLCSSSMQASRFIPNDISEPIIL